MAAKRRLGILTVEEIEVVVLIACPAVRAGAVPPDYSKYCESRFPGSDASVAMDGSATCSVIRWQGEPYDSGIDRIDEHDVDLSDACRQTVGTAQDSVVLQNYADCTEDYPVVGASLTNADWEHYCLTRFGESSRYTPGDDRIPLGTCWVPQAEVNLPPSPSAACEAFHGIKAFRYAKQGDRLTIVCVTNED